jgi:predicted O-methyltransferase YrrM
VGNLGASSSRAARPLERECQQLRPAVPEKPGVARRDLAKRLFLRGAKALHENPIVYPTLVAAFRILQRIGISLTPNHFYWPIPDVSELEKRQWDSYATPPGCDFQLEKQIALARELSSRYGAECSFSATPSETSYHYNNGYFEAVDAEVAYCMVRHYKPARIAEIGTGYSTRVLAAALQKNSERDGLDGQLISVDPNPDRFSQNGWKNLVVQIPKAVQELELQFFDSLENGDALFIDSSHIVGTGSDVAREYLQILPRLKPGVLVHIHDIFLPADYPREAVLNNLWFWSEQYLLQAFLSFNSEFEVLWSSSAMQIECPQVLEKCFPRWQHSFRDMPKSKRRFVPTMDQERVWPSSFWMRRR